MKRVTIIALVLVIIIFLISCKKNGLGGDATIVVYMRHHGNIIKNHVSYPDTVFVKYKSSELPGITPDKFDTYFVGEEGEDHIHCKGLRPGQYFLYAVGMDSAGPYRVTGGQPFKIKWKERKKEFDIDLAVTE